MRKARAAESDSDLEALLGYGKQFFFISHQEFRNSKKLRIENVDLK